MVALNRRCCRYYRGLRRRGSPQSVWTVVVLIMTIMVGLIKASSSPPPAAVQPIKEVLNSHQGYDTDLSDPTPFGYIFRIDAPFRRFGPDQPIHQHNNPKDDQDDQQSFPSYAMMVLKNVTYFSADAPIYFEGYVSIDALHRLRKRSLTNSPVTFQFSTYALDQVLETWFQKFQSGGGSNGNDLRGRMTDVRIVETKDKMEDDGEWRPLVQMQISPIPGLVQTLSYKKGVKDEPMEVFWGPSSSLKKNKGLELVVPSAETAAKNNNNKADAAAFHQIVMGDVLF